MHNAFLSKGFLPCVFALTNEKNTRQNWGDAHSLSFHTSYGSQKKSFLSLHTSSPGDYNASNSNDQRHSPRDVFAVSNLSADFIKDLLLTISFRIMLASTNEH